MITLKYSKIIDLFKKRIIEIVGLLIVTLSVFLLLSLSTYNPEDPNFIFSGNTEIHNLFGFYGSFVSDLFLQSVGIVSFLFCLTIIFFYKSNPDDFASSKKPFTVSLECSKESFPNMAIFFIKLGCIVIISASHCCAKI